MDNPKIIRILSNTKISNGIESFELKKTQNFVVISETETHYFFRFNRDSTDKYSVRKADIKYVTFKYRTIEFKDLKKADILNIFTNYEKLIKLAQQISRYISQLRVEENDMSTMDYNEVDVEIKDDFIVLKRSFIDKTYKCKIPLKYLWDHNWKKTLIKEYGEIK